MRNITANDSRAPEVMEELNRRDAAVLALLGIGTTALTGAAPWLIWVAIGFYLTAVAVWLNPHSHRLAPGILKAMGSVAEVNVTCARIKLDALYESMVAASSGELNKERFRKVRAFEYRASRCTWVEAPLSCLRPQDQQRLGRRSCGSRSRINGSAAQILDGRR